MHPLFLQRQDTWLCVGTKAPLFHAPLIFAETGYLTVCGHQGTTVSCTPYFCRDRIPDCVWAPRHHHFMHPLFLQRQDTWLCVGTKAPLFHAPLIFAETGYLTVCGHQGTTVSCTPYFCKDRIPDCVWAPRHHCFMQPLFLQRQDTCVWAPRHHHFMQPLFLQRQDTCVWAPRHHRFMQPLFLQRQDTCVWAPRHHCFMHPLFLQRQDTCVWAPRHHHFMQPLFLQRQDTWLCVGTKGTTTFLLKKCLCPPLTIPGSTLIALLTGLNAVQNILSSQRKIM